MAEFEPTVAESKEILQNNFAVMLANNPQDGSYYVPHLKMTTATAEGVALQWLISRLSVIFPAFMWSQSESLASDEPGILIRWTKKVVPLADRDRRLPVLPEDSQRRFRG